MWTQRYIYKTNLSKILEEVSKNYIFEFFILYINILKLALLLWWSERHLRQRENLKFLFKVSKKVKSS